MNWTLLMLMGVTTTFTPRPAGPPPSQVYATPILIRYGNFLWPGFPDNPPKFTEADLIGRNARYVDHTRSVKPFVQGVYTFATREGARQVIWIADSLVNGQHLQFTVDGFNWGIYPDQDTPSQSLKITGIPGKVFVTSDQNSGTYNLRITRN